QKVTKKKKREKEGRAHDRSSPAAFGEAGVAAEDLDPPPLHAGLPAIRENLKHSAGTDTDSLQELAEPVCPLVGILPLGQLVVEVESLHAAARPHVLGRAAEERLQFILKVGAAQPLLACWAVDVDVRPHPCASAPPNWFFPNLPLL